MLPDLSRCSSQLSLIGVFLLLFLYVMIKKKIAGRRKAFNAGDRDLEVGQENQQMFRHAKGPAGKDDDSSDVSVLAS